jgi:Zn-dependent peptidase ImmA (M78 family)/transcriptional regulator with XRE-family HTH domain
MAKGREFARLKHADLVPLERTGDTNATRSGEWPTSFGCAKIAHMALARLDAVDIGSRIAQAREDLGLTQAALATAVALDRTALAKTESGKRKVSAAELVRLATTLDRPIDWFVSDPPQAVVSRRADPAAGGQSAVLDRQVEWLARDIDFLEREQILPQIEVRHLDMPADVSEAEEAAARAREWMGVESGPILDLQRCCEAVGLLAFSLALGDEGRDGAYVSADRWGVALINGSVDPGRRRFNLAHELGHHLFADAYAPEVTISPGSETERMINAFAVHLLLPREGLGLVWSGSDDPRLAAVAVAVRFRVSWSAVCAQLKNLGFLDEAQRAELAAYPPTGADVVELGERWVSELDPPSVPPEYGRRVLSAYRAGRLTPQRAVELLRTTVHDEELPARYAIPLDGLRREFDPLP